MFSLRLSGRWRVAELTPDLVDRAVEEASKSDANRDFFFGSLNSPVWIEPLAERGLFADPPQQFIDERGYVRAPGWSASRYLARVASTAPEAVTRIIETIETNSERVHEDIVEAALTMPHEFSRIIALREVEFIGQLDHVYYALPGKAASLAAHMATLGEVEIALDLLRKLFAPSPDVRDEGFGTKRLQARLRDWEYDRLLAKLVGELVTIAPGDLVKELVALLGQALDLLRPEDGDDEHFDVICRIWRVRIADDRDRAVRLEESLVSALRDAARAIHESGLLTDEELVGLLLARPEELFQRIAMDALARPPEPDIETIRRLVVDPVSLVDEPSVEHRELLTANAERLPREDIDLLVDAIRAGPDTAQYRKRVKEALDREATDEEIERYVASWRVSRLEFLVAGLDEAGRREYEALRAIAPDAEVPVSFEVRTFAGPSSPFTTEQLGELNDDELLELLRTWEPPDDWMGPSQEGLARTLAAFAQEDPARVARLSAGLRDLRPAFVQWAFEGLTTALRDGGNEFDWDPVIDLVEWVAEQPREIPGGRGDDYSDLDPGWVWTRRQIVSLLERGLDLEDSRTVPLERRTSVWTVIRTVAEDPDPTPENEAKYGGSNMDPLTLALNSTRPRALFAAISYGSWLKRMLRAEGEDFLSATAPELAELLERHLDPALDPSVAVRAAIAHHYASVFVLDANWARQNATRIFPAEHSALREAAWGAYAIYTRPYDDLFVALRDVYERSADLAGEPGHEFRWDSAPQAHLGEHLASFYWRAKVELDEPLFVTFWSRAQPEIRRHVVDFLGRSVSELPELEEEVRERLIRFWEFAREHAAAAGTVEELAPLAWWVKCEALPVGWRLDNLSGILDLHVKPDPVYAVIESLPAISEEEPAYAVNVLRRILEIEQADWSYDLWDEQTSAVLRTALHSGDLAAYELAVATTHWLGERGYRQYGELLG